MKKTIALALLLASQANAQPSTSAQAPQGPSYTITLPADAWNTVGNGLNELQHKTAAPIYNEIVRQILEQQKRVQEPPKAAEEPPK